jgi:hypothetical protein
MVLLIFCDSWAVCLSLSGSPSGANGQAAPSTNSYNAPPGRVGRTSNKGLERKQRKTAGLKPEHQDTPRLFPSPSG